MPRRLAEVGEGHEDGNGVYGIIRDLIVEGKDARFVNKKGRFVVNWSRALDCFTDYKAKKNPQFKSKAVSRRKISNGFRSALLNYYKKEGAKEYKDAKKVNENDEVVERQFQMPPRLFKSMFRDVGPTVTEDSEEDDQEDTSSLVSSEGDDKPEVSRSTSTSDTGFDEFMDMSSHEIVEPLESSLAVAGNFLTDLGLDVIKTEGEETSVGLSDVQLPPASEMFDPSMLDSAIEEICSDGISDDISDERIDLFGVVQDICPTSGSVKGGFQFYISLTEELPDEVKTGVAQFERVANVMVYKLNPFTLTGTVPSSQVPGEVAVTVVTDAGKKLGMTCFRYIDEMREMVRQIVKDPTLQSLWFAMWSQEHGFFGNDSNIAQVLGPIDLQGQDSSVQTKQQQSVKVLQLLVYTAAQTDAREFIEMVFSTSAGQIVFNCYKDRTPLPEDVAQANGHEELAQYLADINTRLSKETFEDVQSCAIDWLELVKAVQKQSSQDESTKGLQQPSDIDDTSDYFADVETSSCGSSDHDIVWTNMSDNKAAWKCPRGSPILQEPCTDEDIFNDVHPVGTTMSENGPSNKCPLKATNSDETLKKAEESTQRPTTRPVVDKKGTPSKHEAQLDNENDKEGVTYGSFAHAFDCISRWWRKKDSGPIARAQDNCLDEKEEELPSKSRSLFQGLFWRGSDTSEANVHGASGPHMTKPKECHKRPGRATGRSTRKKETGLNYKGVVLTFALLTVLAGFKLKEGQILHWAVGNGYTQFSKMLLQCGVYVDVPGLLEETPLHLAAKNGFREAIQIAGPLFNNGGQVHARKVETPFHWARKSGPRRTSQFFTQPNEISSRRNENYLPSQLVARNGQHRGVVNVKNSSLQANFLNLASRTGRRQIAESSIRRGIEITAKDIQRQETSFIQQRSGINARICEKDVSPHWAARNESCRLKSSPELVVRRLGQVSVSSVLCHWLKKKFSATSDVISSARRKIPRLPFTRGGGLWNCMNEIDLIFKTQTKSPIFTEKHQQASLGAKDLVDQSLVQSQMSIRKEKLLTLAFSSLSDSESFSSSDRNTSQVLSWYTTVLCVDGKCGKDGINWVLTNNFFVIIGYCVGLCFVFVALNLSFFWGNKQTVCFARHCSILPFLHCITGSEVKCIRTKGLIETKEGDKCVKEAADNGALGDKGRTQTIPTKNSASELFERKFFPEVETFGYQQLNKDKSVRRLRMEWVRKWLECNHDQDVLSSVESEVELSPTMSRFSSSTLVKELTIDETVNIEMPESADTVPSVKQSHAVTGCVQGTYIAVSCITCGHGDYTCQRCEKCSSCGNKDVLVNCSINRDAVCSKSCKSNIDYCNENDGQSYPCTECCGKDKTNIEPVPLKRKEKDSGAKEVASMAQSDAVAGSLQLTLRPNVDEPVPLKRKKRDSGAPAGKSVVVLKSSYVTVRNDSVFLPNTIEMAKLKKKEKRQFLTNVQITSKMSQQDVRELLISLFPYLEDQRFYCASAEDNRTRLDFHGERRIWDGHLIKQKIKGNSSLYIFTDEGSLRRQDSSTHSKQPTLDEILVGNGAATRVQEGVTCNCAAQSKRGSVVNTEVECAGKSGSVSNATDAHNHEDAGTSRSDYEEALNKLNSFLTSIFQDEMDHFKPGCVDSHLQASEEEADENKEGRFSRFLSDQLDVLYGAREEDYSGFAAWSPSEDYDLEDFRDFSFPGHPGGQDGPGKDKFLLSEESIQRLRHVTLKDPKRKSLRRGRPPVRTHETLCRYVIVTDTTASDYLDTLSRITTGTWCESGDFAKPSRYPCNRSTNVDEGLYRRWSLCKDGTSNRPSLVKTAEKADQHSSASTKLKKSANEIGAERGSCRHVDAEVYEIRSPTPFVPCILRDKENCQ